MIDSNDRCTGLCCKAFNLGLHTVEELQLAYDNAVRIESEGMWDWIRPTAWNTPEILGITKWWPWMIYLGRYKVHPTTGEDLAQYVADGVDMFTCTKLAPNGDCMVYDIRPHFCRAYGVTHPCVHTTCAWKSGWHVGEPRPRSGLEKLRAMVKRA